MFEAHLLAARPSWLNFSKSTYRRQARICRCFTSLGSQVTSQDEDSTHALRPTIYSTVPRASRSHEAIGKECSILCCSSAKPNCLVHILDYGTTSLSPYAE